jgi:hypothetical protein
MTVAQKRLMLSGNSATAKSRSMRRAVERGFRSGTPQKNDED